jgi:LuxR family transcriptional regulator, maltose regulon positive regulatory protein
MIGQGHGEAGAERWATPAHQKAAEAIVIGNEALARGQWEAARASFEVALRLEETAEAMEGLGMAASCLDDGSATFDARERAYRLYRLRGDRRAAARLAIALADDHFNFRREPAVAGGWLQRARRLLAGLAPIPEHGWLNLEESYFALAEQGDAARGLELASDAAAIARGIADVDLEMAAVAIEGLSLVLAGRVSEGMSRLDEATTAVISGEMTDPVAISRACCVLVTACERSRDFERAAQWCHHIKESSRRMRFSFPLAICRTHYATVLLWQGSWTEAEDELRTVVDQLGATYLALKEEAWAGLANLRRQQGRFDEAASILGEIDGRPLAILGRAALALDRGRAATAAPLAQRFLRRLPSSNQTDRLPALEVLLRAQLALGQREEARGSLEQIRAVTGRFGTAPMKVSALVAEALVASAEGDHPRARIALEDAIELCSRTGGLFELARCRIQLGRVLVACGDREESEAQIAQALKAFARLGAAAHMADLGTAGRPDRAVGERAAPAAAGAAAVPLTRREVEVLRLVAQGMSNHEIARHLVISEFTVKRHVANLLAKLGLPSRAAAAAYAGRRGLA